MLTSILQMVASIRLQMTALSAAAESLRQASGGRRVMVENLTKRSLQLAILGALGSVRHQHKFNLLGKGDAQGDLERQLGVRFEPNQRHLAAVAFAELEAAGLLRPT